MTVALGSCRVARPYRWTIRMTSPSTTMSPSGLRSGAFAQPHDGSDDAEEAPDHDPPALRGEHAALPRLAIVT